MLPSVPRLFVAIEAPDDVRHRLAALCKGVTGARWVKPEQIHLTLRFVGHVDEAEAARIEAGLARLRTSTFTMEASGLGTFPPRRAPR